MSVERVHAEWVRDHVFLLRDRNDFRVVMTQPQGINGSDLLPMSLIGCAAWDVIDILHKQRQNVTGLQVEAISTRDPDPPWKYRKIEIIYHITGRGLDDRHIRRAVELSETKYCSIYATLRDVIELVSTFEIIEG